MLTRAMILLTCLLSYALPARAEQVLVFAAASLKEPLDALAAMQPGVVISYGGSGTLARQVLAGAPADIVFMAHPDWMAALAEAGLVADPFDLLGNELVVIGPAAAPDLALTPAALLRALDGGRLAIGMTGSVPAGIYGKTALGFMGLWESLSGQLAEVDSVRAVLALVARGEAPLGVVYVTDARVSEQVRVVARFPAQSHAPIRYGVAAVTGRVRPAVTDFMTILQGDAARAIFADAGFVPLVEAR